MNINLLFNCAQATSMTDILAILLPWIIIPTAIILLYYYGLKYLGLPILKYKHEIKIL